MDAREGGVIAGLKLLMGQKHRIRCRCICGNAGFKWEH